MHQAEWLQKSLFAETVNWVGQVGTFLLAETAHHAEKHEHFVLVEFARAGILTSAEMANQELGVGTSAPPPGNQAVKVEVPVLVEKGN